MPTGSLRWRAYHLLRFVVLAIASVGLLWTTWLPPRSEIDKSFVVVVDIVLLVYAAYAASLAHGSAKCLLAEDTRDDAAIRREYGFLVYTWDKVSRRERQAARRAYRAGVPWMGALEARSRALWRLLDDLPRHIDRP